jgi:TatD DNase family protein
MYDAHLHLQDERFDACRNAVIAAALAAGVTGGCCCGSAPEDWEAVSRIRNSACGARSLGPHAPASALPFPDSTRRTPHPEFFILPAFGVHPWHAANLPADWLTQLEELLVRHPEAPVGEIGIDGLRDDPSRDAQRQVLCAQLELAARLHRPVVLHGARAWGELLAIVKPFAPRLPGFVTHAFSGSDDILREIVALGGFLSFAGAVCNPAARRVRAAAAAAPAERLLLETDAPDMIPMVQGSGFRVQGVESGVSRTINHPANLVYVARAVAELRGTPVEEIAALTTANARRIYRIAEPVLRNPMERKVTP